MTLKTKIVMGLLAFLLIVATISALYAWYRTPPVVSKTEYVEVPKIQVVTKIKEVRVPGPTEIVTVEKQVLVQKIGGLPAWFIENKDEQAIASAVIEAYRGQTNTVATINTKTGVGHILAQQKPLSLFGLLNEKAVGIRAGAGSRSGTESSVYGSWTFVRVGSAYIGLYGEANTVFGGTGTSQSDAKAMVQIEYRF